MDRSELLERVLKVYTSSHDIERMPEEAAPLTATAAFHEHGVGYVMVRKAQMWTADRHEYVYIFNMPHLTAQAAEDGIKKTLELGEPLVNPQKGHMSTNLVAMFLCDSADADALDVIRKFRKRKSFQFSLMGWMEVQTAAAIVGKADAVSNAAGRLLAKFLKRQQNPVERKNPLARSFPFLRK